VLERGVVAPLEPDRRKGIARQGAAAERPRIVAWKDADVVGELEQACERGIQRAGCGGGFVARMEVRPSDVADEK
jgi:hypothetical protein